MIPIAQSAVRRFIPTPFLLEDLAASAAARVILSHIHPQATPEQITGAVEELEKRAIAARAYSARCMSSILNGGITK